MSDIEIQLWDLSIYDIALRKIKQYCGKKTKDIADKKEKEKNTNHFLKKKMVFLSLKSLHVI